MVLAAFMPESPKWLLVKGKVDQAEKILRKVVKFNGTQWPEDFELQPVVCIIGNYDHTTNDDSTTTTHQARNQQNINLTKAI